MFFTLTRPTRAAAALRSARPALPWRYVVPRALALWLATRLLDVALTILFVPGTAAHRFTAWNFFDAKFYEAIAWTGYAPAHPWLAAFYPLYPLLMHPFLLINAAERQVAALVVGNLGTLAAFIAVGLLAAHELRSGPRAARWAMALLAASPLGVFLAGAYTDGLFVALAAWALLAGRRRAWEWAALAAALGIVARPFGVLLVPALLMEYGSQHGWLWRVRARAWTPPTRQTVRHVALLILLPAAALLAFMAALWRSYGDPLDVLHIHGTGSPGHFAWGYGLRWPWQTLALAWRQLTTLPHWSWPEAHLLLDLLPVLLCLTIVLLTARRAPLDFTVLSGGVVVICLILPLTGLNFPDPLAGDGRYCYAAVPVLLQLGAWLQRWPRWCAVSLLALSLLLQGVLTVFVLRGGWLV